MTAVIRKISRREQIQAKATTLFREKGYSASSMRHLADHIGMEAASLYNHISSKEELLREICFSVAASYIQQLNEVEQSNVSASEQVDRLIRFQVRMMIEQFEKVYVSNRDWKHLKEPYLGDFLTKRRNYEKRFAIIIEKAIAKGEFKKMNAYVAVLAMLSAVRGIEFWHKNKKNVSALQLENDMTDMLINGLKS